MRRRAAAARVARVGTLDEHGRVHLVPIVFVVDGDTLYSSSDPSDRRVKRLRNIETNPGVVVLVDEYDEEWENVWWVRMRGRGRVLEDGAEVSRARELLAEKYPQYEGDPGSGPVMAVDVEQWRAWAYSD